MLRTYDIIILQKLIFYDKKPIFASLLKIHLPYTKSKLSYTLFK